MKVVSESDVELSKDLALSLSYLRDALEPTTAELEASRSIALRVLESSPGLAPNPPVHSPSEVERVPAQPGSFQLALGARGLLGLASAGALALAAVFVLGRASVAPRPDAALAAQAPASLSSTSEPQGGVDSRAASGPAAAPSPPVVTPRVSSSDEPAPHRPSGTAPRRARRAVQLDSATSLLQRAEEALRQDNPRQALALAKRVPRTDGTAENLDFIRLVARCQLGEDVRERRTEFLARWQRTPYERRLDQDCPRGESP